MIKYNKYIATNEGKTFRESNETLNGNKPNPG